MLESNISLLFQNSATIYAINKEQQLGFRLFIDRNTGIIRRPDRANLLYNINEDGTLGRLARDISDRTKTFSELRQDGWEFPWEDDSSVTFVRNEDDSVTINNSSINDTFSNPTGEQEPITPTPEPVPAPTLTPEPTPTLEPVPAPTLTPEPTPILEPIPVPTSSENNEEDLLPKKSPSSLKIDYELEDFLTARGEVDRVQISLSGEGGTASWENGSITLTEKISSFNPRIYSSRKDGSDRSQPNKQVDSSEYFPLATVTVTNNQDLDKPLVDNSGIALISQIKVSLEGENQTTEFAPLDLQRIGIDIKDFLTGFSDADKVEIGGSLIGYQNLTIADSQTGRLEASPFYFGYVGAVEGSPREITKDELLVGKENRADLKDGETKTYTLYGRIFSTEQSSVVDITSISEDTEVAGDFRTSDNTLIFNGTAEPLSQVEVFVESNIEGFERGVSIGTANTDSSGNWSLDYTAFEFLDGEYGLTATATDLKGNIATTNQTQLLEVDTDFDITFELPKRIDPLLKDPIEEAGEFWEQVIIGDLPDVGNIDDLKIEVSVADLGNPNELARAEPTLFRDDDTKLPYSAEMKINQTTLDGSTPKSQIVDTIKHEIGHALGFSKPYLLKRRDLLTGVTDVSLTPNIGFKGKNALKAYREFSEDPIATAVPMELESKATGLAGVFNDYIIVNITDQVLITFADLGHWKENNLGDELMTPKLNGRDAFLSPITVGAFADIGYEVA